MYNAYHRGGVVSMIYLSASQCAENTSGIESSTTKYSETHCQYPEQKWDGEKLRDNKSITTTHDICMYIPKCPDTHLMLRVE